MSTKKYCNVVSPFTLSVPRNKKPDDVFSIPSYSFKKHNKLLHDIFSVSNLYSCKHSKFQLALIWNKLKGCCFLKEDIKVICDCFIMSEGVGSATMKCSAASCMIPLFHPRVPFSVPGVFYYVQYLAGCRDSNPRCAITNELHTSLFKKIFLYSHTED